MVQTPNNVNVPSDYMALPKRVACVECRQQKVRCDAYIRHPEPCTRCTNKELSCNVQSNFKRAFKRQRLVDVEKEVQRLRTTVEQQHSSKRRQHIYSSSNDLVHGHQYHDLPGPVDALVDTEKTACTQTDSNQNGSAVSSGRTEVDFSNLTCTEKSMSGVTLLPETIIRLYKEYVTNYHPFFPVLDITKGPEEIYALSPALFWTIMTVSSRRFDDKGELMMSLSEILKQCLSELLISPFTRFGPAPLTGVTGRMLNISSAYTVQAFIIFTMWPSITSSLNADPSWNLAGIAMYSAIRVGLHCPGFVEDFGRVKSDNPSYPKVSEQMKTWICCNIASQTVATVYGFPTFTRFDASVLAACDASSPIDIPEPVKQLMHIQRLEEEIAKTLNSNTKDPLGLSELSDRISLIQMLTRKLDELEIKLGAIDDHRKFVILSARVHLLTYYYLDNGGFSDLEFQKGILQAYNSACALLEHAHRTDQRDPTFFKFLPWIYNQILWQSSAMICKVYHSPFAQFIDGNAARKNYMRCVKLIRKASILKHDMMDRASEIMLQMWRFFGALARRNATVPRVMVRTRMAASVFIDCFWVMREEFVFQNESSDGDEEGPGGNNGTRSAIEEDHGEDLDPAHGAPSSSKGSQVAASQSFLEEGSSRKDKSDTQTFRLSSSGGLAGEYSDRSVRLPTSETWRDMSAFMNDLGFAQEDMNFSNGYNFDDNAFSFNI